MLSLLLASGLTLTQTQCEKKDAPSGNADGKSLPSAVADAVTEAVTGEKAGSFSDHASKLGFAAHLNADTEFYLGTVAFKTHLEALKKTAFYKEATAMVEDKTPAASADDEAQEALKKLWGDDIFISGGAGLAKSFALLRDFNRIYTEFNFKTLMSGASGGDLSAGLAGGSMTQILSLGHNPEGLKQVAKLVSDFELPPLIIGIKTADPEGILKSLIKQEALEQIKSAKFEVTEHKTPLGHTFTVASLDMKTVVTPENKEQVLSNLPPDLPQESRDIIAKAYDDVAAKTIKFAWGTAHGHVLFAMGSNLDHLKFAEKPESSLLGKKEFNDLVPHAGKNLTALSYLSQGAAAALVDDQPFAPMLRGAVSALKENETFKDIGNSLDGEVKTLVPLEQKVFHYDTTASVGAFWWDNGIHMDVYGGFKSKLFTPGQALKFARLLDQPGVVFGLAYKKNPEYTKSVRAWMHQLFGIAYKGAQQLVQSGIAGAEGGQKFAMFEMMLLPTLQKVYQANLDIEDKGLGGEAAFLLDVNGKLPSLPSVPADPNIKFPRITVVSEVANREEIGKGWGTIQETVMGIAAIMGASGPNGPALPTAQSVVENGLSIWFYENEFFNGDLNPVSALNDKVLFLSTSKEAVAQFAPVLDTPVTTEVDGLVWKLDLAALGDFAQTAAGVSPTTSPEQAEEVRQNLKWLKPFRTMNGRIFEDGGKPRQTLDWEIVDLVSFD